MRILVVSAHPDDMDFGAAGTVALCTDAGASVVYCVITDGESGGSDPRVPRHEMRRIRRAEQEAAARTVGVDDVRFLGYGDGTLQATPALRRDLARVIRQVRPDRVLCPSPEYHWDHIPISHPDHLAAGAATIAAVYPDARNRFAHRELAEEEALEPHVVPEVWLIDSPRSEHFVDITGVYDRKLAALACHASQMDHLEGGPPQALEDHLRANGVRAGLPEGHLAEAFQVVDTR